MSLISLLVAELGPIIGRFILGFWLHDDDLISDGIGTTFDILFGKSKDFLASRRAAREIEIVIETICQQLVPIFEMDTSINREAVVNSVRDTFAGLNITKEIVQQDLDPTRLSKVILQRSSDYVLGLNSKEETIYIEIVADVCRYTVTVSSHLPGFHENAFSEILQRENLLIDTTKQVLVELKEIRENSEKENLDRQGARFQNEYIQAVIRQLSKIELFGLSMRDSVSRITKKYSLEIAYIPIQLKSANETSNQPVEPTMDSIEDLLSVHNRLFIIGEPGAGKTTILQWIAVRTAYRDFPAPLDKLNGKIPFFIPLRSYVKTGFPTIEEFPRLIAQANIGVKPEHWVEQQFRDGKALLLIDGVDEIANKEDLFNWLDVLVKTYEKAIYVLTSRPLEEADIILPQFPKAEIQLMQPASIDIFIDKWHSAIEMNLNSAEAKQKIEILAFTLKLVIRQNRAIRNLATNPLLCAVICALNYEMDEMGGAIPKNRLGLYEACCLMLLRRDEARKINLSAHLGLSQEQKRKILENLAYYFVRNGWSELPIAQVRRQVAKVLRYFSDLPKTTTPKQVTQSLLDRSGIIRQPINGRVDFTHKTFQEYLGAKEAIDQDDIGLMIKQAHTDRWREVVLLAAGHANRKQQRLLIKGLIERGDQEIAYKHQLHLMAVACLENADEISPNTRSFVNERIKELVPPKNLSEARAIASAGDLAVPHLLNWKDEGEIVVGACLVSLALIGSPAALMGLKNYSDDTDTGQALLVRVWDYFDKEEYAKTVLKDFDELELPSLDGVQYLLNLKHIRYVGKEAPNSFAILSELPQFETIDLGSFDELEVITLDGLQYISSPVKKLLYTGNKPPQNLTVLSSLSDLEAIELGPFDRYEITSLDELKYVAKTVKHIHYTGKNLPSDLTALSKVPLLQSIDFINTDSLELSSLEGLQYVVNLGKLIYIGKELIKDLSPIAKLYTLEHLELSYLQKLTDISPLKNIRGLHYLSLKDATNLKDLSPLSGLTQLKYLYISGLNDSDHYDTIIQTIPHLRALTHLYMHGLSHLTDTNTLTRSLRNIQDSNFKWLIRF